MAFIKEESEDIKIEEAFNVKQEDTEVFNFKAELTHLILVNPLGARVFWKKCWILTSRFQKLVAWKGLKIEIYCKLEKCWEWPKVYVGCKYTHLICILWRHKGAALLNFIIFRK